MQDALADLQAIRDKYQVVTIMALVFVSTFHFVHPMALLKQAEKVGMAKPGAAGRLATKEPDWEELILEMFDVMENTKAA